MFLLQKDCFKQLQKTGLVCFFEVSRRYSDISQQLKNLLVYNFWRCFCYKKTVLVSRRYSDIWNQGKNLVPYSLCSSFCCKKAVLDSGFQVQVQQYSVRLLSVFLHRKNWFMLFTPLLAFCSRFARVLLLFWTSIFFQRGISSWQSSLNGSHLVEKFPNFDLCVKT